MGLHACSRCKRPRPWRVWKRCHRTGSGLCRASAKCVGFAGRTTRGWHIGWWRAQAGRGEMASDWRDAYITKRKCRTPSFHSLSIASRHSLTHPKPPPYLIKLPIHNGQGRQQRNKLESSNADLLPPPLPLPPPASALPFGSLCFTPLHLSGLRLSDLFTCFSTSSHAH